MSTKLKDKINISPTYNKVKHGVENESDEETVDCKKCCKSFASFMALQNHVKMEHFDWYMTGDKNQWLENSPKTNDKEEEPEEILIKKKTEELISSMQPVSLTCLASEDVSYIIMKPDDDAEEIETANHINMKLKKKTKKVNIKKNKQKDIQSKHKEQKEKVKLIPGPFECLQPCKIAADSTCHQTFSSCCEYTIHYRDEHTRGLKTRLCHVCEQPLPQGNLDSDLPVKSFPYTCKACTAGFTTLKELSEHISTSHINLKPYKCSVCSKRFSHLSGAQRHLRMHIGEKPFQCLYCNKAFVDRSNLNQHVRVHTKDKPYRCVVCGKMYSQCINLKQHMRTHTNIHPFQCTICEKKFKQRNLLKHHLKKHNIDDKSDEQKQNHSVQQGSDSQGSTSLVEENGTDINFVEIEIECIEIIENLQTGMQCEQ